MLALLTIVQSNHFLLAITSYLQKAPLCLEIPDRFFVLHFRNTGLFTPIDISEFSGSNIVILVG